MSTSGSSSAASDAESRSSRALSGPDDDERPDQQPAAAGETGAASGHWQEPDAVRVKAPYAYMICGALLAMLVTGFLGSVVTLIVLPSCLRGQEDVRPCVPQPTKPQAPVTPPTPSTPAASTPSTPAASTSSTPSTPAASTPSTPAAVATTSSTPVVPVVPGLVDPPVKVFTRGKLFYRSAYMDDIRGHLFVGAIWAKTWTAATTSAWCSRYGMEARSTSVAPTPGRPRIGKYRLQTSLWCRRPTRYQWWEPMCRNRRKVAAPTTSTRPPNHCGWMTFMRADDAPSTGISSVVALTALSTGQYGFFRYGVPNPRGLLLLSTDSSAVQKPDLVGAFSTTEHAYFVFREEGIERKACGARNLSTVARVCKNEVGISTQNADPWTSLMKVRLRCIDSAAANFSFDEIHASHWVRDLESGVLFGAFVSVTRTWAGAANFDSAVCAFSLQDIEEEFASSTFYELIQRDIYTLSRPLHLSQVLSPRPGVTCPPGPRTMSSADARFWVTHPLVTKTPKQRHNRPFYAHAGVAIRSLVAFVLNETWGAWVVCYAATEEGAMLKVAEEIAAGGQVPAPARLVDTFAATTEPIRKMLVSLKHRSLYVLTDVDVRQYSTDACEGRHIDCPSCLLDPFCGWDGNKCLPHTDGSKATTRRTC
ncbi:semaphorin-3F-like [Rhipicephalus sanguineus]|uniref:semaphorin-3F-like n=1 Tax=Rhipicephalus sanguineus TaxID=34632 RepID=UPI0020C33BA5|nr:semaphorin-3F-like [Rhipicephalus sanguineus]